MDSKIKAVFIDPSGDWGKDGMGSTGIGKFVFNNVNHTLEDAYITTIKAKEFDSKISYQKSVLEYIEELLKGDDDIKKVIVCEDYIPYSQNAKTDTSELIGAIRMRFENVDIHMQKPHVIKTVRFNDKRLVRLNILGKKGTFYTFKGERTTNHARDALKHGLKFVSSIYGVAVAEIKIK